MYRFSKGSEGHSSLEIHDMMSFDIEPDIINFAVWMPGNGLFPVKGIDSIFKSTVEKKKQLAFQYWPTQGYPPLPESLREFLRKKEQF
jgi:2-aminoadipate transaminase